MVAILGNAYTPWRSVVIGAINETQTISTDETMIPVHPWDGMGLPLTCIYIPGLRRQVRLLIGGVTCILV